MPGPSHQLLIGGAVTLVVSFLLGTYGELGQRQLSIEAERRKAYGSFMAEVESCFPPDLASLQADIAAAEEDPAAAAVEESNTAMIGPETQVAAFACRRRLSVAQAAVELLTNDDDVLAASRALSMQTSELSDQTLTLGNHLLNGNLDEFEVVAESASETIDRRSESLISFVYAARDDTGVSTTYGDQLVVSSLRTLAPALALAVAGVGLWNWPRRRAPLDAEVVVQQPLDAPHEDAR